MVGPPSMLSTSATPTQKSLFSQQSYSTTNLRQSSETQDGLRPNGGANGLRGNSYAPRGSSLVSPGPGSFSSNMRSQLAPSRSGSGLDMNASMVNLERLDEDDGAISGQALSTLRESLNREVLARFAYVF